MFVQKFVGINGNWLQTRLCTCLFVYKLVGVKTGWFLAKPYKTIQKLTKHIKKHVAKHSKAGLCAGSFQTKQRSAGREISRATEPNIAPSIRHAAKAGRLMSFVPLLELVCWPRVAWLMKG